MAATQRTPAASALVDRQVQRLGIQPWQLTPAALALLIRRRRMRLISAWAVSVPLVALFVLVTWSTVRLPADFTDAQQHGYALRAGGVTAFFGFYFLVLFEAKRILDRRLTTRLATRVSRPERVGPITVLGRVRTLCLAVLILGQAIIAAALFAVHIAGFGAYRYGFLIAFAGCTTASVLGVAREVQRPAIAVDAISLTIDERQRSQDAFAAIWPVIYLGISGMTNLAPVTAPDWFDTLALFISSASLLAWIAATAVNPWPGTRPLPWTARPARPAR